MGVERAQFVMEAGAARFAKARELSGCTGNHHPAIRNVQPVVEQGGDNLVRNSMETDMNITNKINPERTKPIFENAAGKINRRTCMLMVTHRCNLNCTYCYETHKDNKEMSFDMAKSILVREFEFVKESEKFDELEIDFMGGEPLMNFSLIKRIVEWLDSEPPHVPYICFASTNGTLLDDGMKNWFSRYRSSICLGVSYDGYGSIQSINRGEVTNGIDYNFFRALWPTQYFKFTISKEGLPNLARSFIEAHKNGFLMAGSLAQGLDWNANDAKVYLEQLRILYNFYLENLDVKPVNLLTRFILIEPQHQQRRQCKFCGTGEYMQTYDIDGSAYGCHMFTSIVCGEDKKIFTSDIDWNDTNIAEDDFCANCCIKNFCPTCMGFNYHYRGNLASRDKRLCNMILAEAIASCEFQMKRLTICDDLRTVNDAVFAKFALAAYPVLSQFDVEKSIAPFVDDFPNEEGKEVRK